MARLNLFANHGGIATGRCGTLEQAAPTPAAVFRTRSASVGPENRAIGYFLGVRSARKQVQSPVMRMAGQTFLRLVKSYAVSSAVWMSTGFISLGQHRVNHPNEPLTWSLVVSLVAFFFAATVLSPPVFYLARKYPLAREATLRRVLFYIGGAPLFVAAYAFVRWLIAAPDDPSGPEQAMRTLHMMSTVVTSNLATLWWVYLEILLAANAYEYFERARTESLEKAQLEQALAASELQALKAQIQPHFLFNTLHGIATLADTDGARAKAMVLQLANLLRAALERGSSDLISLQDELRFITAYLDLEKMRLGDRLLTRWSIADDARNALVPHLILQPLVENAIIHGASSSRSGGYISIDARQESESLLLTVRNSLGVTRTSGTGLGLRNTETRLKHLYGPDAFLKFVVSKEQNTATVIVRLPYLVTAGVPEQSMQMEA